MIFFGQTKAWNAVALVSLAIFSNGPMTRADDAAAKGGDPKLPGIVVRAKDKVVEVDGKICLNEGILEFLAVVPGPDSREYESVLSLNCRPSHFQAALLLAQLNRLPEQTERRWKNARLLAAKLEGVRGIRPRRGRSVAASVARR